MVATRYESVVKLQASLSDGCTPLRLYTTRPLGGHEMPAKYTHEQRIAAFWLKVDRNGPIPEHRPDLGPCWLWTGAVTCDGYGKIGWREEGARHQTLAHIVGYRMQGGSLPAGTEHDHLCRVRRCVRATHLEPVTRRENALRGVSFSAVNAAKTHCDRGHAFDEQNTGSREKGRRRCLACQRDAVRRYKARKNTGIAG